MTEPTTPTPAGWYEPTNAPEVPSAPLEAAGRRKLHDLIREEAATAPAPADWPAIRRLRAGLLHGDVLAAGDAVARFGVHATALANQVAVLRRAGYVIESGGKPVRHRVVNLDHVAQAAPPAKPTPRRTRGHRATVQKTATPAVEPPTGLERPVRRNRPSVPTPPLGAALRLSSLRLDDAAPAGFVAVLTDGDGGRWTVHVDSYRPPPTGGGGGGDDPAA